MLSPDLNFLSCLLEGKHRRRRVRADLRPEGLAGVESWEHSGLGVETDGHLGCIHQLALQVPER